MAQKTKRPALLPSSFQKNMNSLKPLSKRMRSYRKLFVSYKQMSASLHLLDEWLMDESGYDEAT
jgi:hypothetical protein